MIHCSAQLTLAQLATAVNVNKVVVFTEFIYQAVDAHNDTWKQAKAFVLKPLSVTKQIWGNIVTYRSLNAFASKLPHSLPVN
jgi:hypothetical protein